MQTKEDSNVGPESADTAALLARARIIGTSTWSDAMDDLGIDGVCSGLCHRGGAGRCVGFAATAKAEVGELGAFETKDFGLNRMLDSAAAGEVIVVDVGGAEISAMGGIGALTARNRGLAGVLIDGGCRDVTDIRDSGLWVASRFVTPRTGKRRLRLGHFGEPALLGGVRVDKGDLVVADPTGVVIVPRARLLEVLSAAERMHRSDSTKEDALRAGKTLEEARRLAGG